ncbi:type II toxin-antitoxin system RatA family toxin [Colwellia sp. D2M02]|uniref:Type II toxin-antitoxin system RatA family toxin n=1 Tax=Colwellia asteriadis TaxID=517723 RepID=A0ABN1L6R9_9GAMM|nr:type II toxin-antitoxin system RatA family toxin [Colwellia sp. D2M02]MBU2892355.1 type II toxin-antitoxin system RatA family toxin [Colwellia sp. D2M02]
MPTISRSALVMHNVDQMYELINDIHAYPSFLPDCDDSKVIAQDSNTVTAALLVSKGGLSKWFTTKNTLISNEKIKLSLVDGPFKKLEGYWLLTPLSDEACKISLELEYEFSNKLVSLAFGKVFSHFSNSLVQVFIQRAKQIYGAQ